MKPYAYKQSEVSYETDGVPIEECAGDLMYIARLSFIRSRSESEPE